MTPEARAISAAARKMLPEAAALAWRDPTLAYPLLGSEAALIERAIPRRRNEFSAGRDAARAALSQLGMPPTEIGAQNRVPIWPDGITGSITHSATHCLAAVVKTGDLDAIGVDLEPSRPAGADLGKDILTLQEQDIPEDMVLRSFAAKEALYKALSKRARRVMSFQEVTLVWAGGTAQATLLKPAGSWPEAAQFTVSTCNIAGHWLASCVIAKDADR